jgi:hypothetical protein
MKARDFGFLLAGLFLGAIVCAFALLPHRTAPEVVAKPAVPAAPEVSAISPATPVTPEPAYQAGGHVYLAGDVHKQGVVEIRPNETLTVSQALALGGGPAAAGDLHKVKLLRLKPDGTSETIPADLNISDSGYVKDPAVQPGDVINVPDKLKSF